MKHTVIDTNTLINLIEIAHRYDELFGDQIKADIRAHDKQSVNLAKVCLEESYPQIVAAGYNSSNKFQSERFNVTHNEAVKILNDEKLRIQMSQSKSRRTSRIEKLNQLP